MTASKFKKGDRVRSVRTGETGVIEYGGKYTPDVDVVWDKSGDHDIAQDADLEPATPTEAAKIEAALARTKKDLGLCEDFDLAVERARNMTFVERLDHVAISMHRGDVFRHFEDILHAPDYVRPDVPEVGDYVRLTMADGKTHEGEVTKITVNRYYCAEAWAEMNSPKEHYIQLNGKDVSAWVFEHQEHIDNINEPGWTVTKVEHIDRPVEIPEIGKWIKAEYKDGHTDTFEVDRNQNNGAGNIFLNVDGDKGFIQTEGKGDMPQRIIVSWKYVPAPVKPVEIDGFLVIYPDSNGAYRAYDPKEQRLIKEGKAGLITAWNKDDARAEIKRLTDEGRYSYIPALLAIIKFIALEEEKK